MSEFSLFDNFSPLNSQEKTLLEFVNEKGLKLYLTENVNDNFVVLTGKNGVGKSRLLQLIRDYIVTIINKDFPHIIVRKLDYGELDDKYDPDSTDHPLVTENILNLECNLENWQDLIYKKSCLDNYLTKVFKKYYNTADKLNSIKDHIKSKRIECIYFDEFKKFFRRQILKKICFGSLKQMLMLNMRYQFELDEINKIIESDDNFKYILQKNNRGFADKSDDINERIIFSSRNQNGNVRLELKFNDLSPGERLTLHLILLIKDKDYITMNYNENSETENIVNAENSETENIQNAENSGSIKQVLLLDEPDSHCHSSLSDNFIKIIEEIVVKYMNIQVIMTTHNFNTVSHPNIKNNCLYSLIEDKNHVQIKKRIENLPVDLIR